MMSDIRLDNVSRKKGRIDKIELDCPMYIFSPRYSVNEMMSATLDWALYVYILPLCFKNRIFMKKG